VPRSNDFLADFCRVDSIDFFQVQCSKSQVGYGRRRRAISYPEIPNDPNKVFEITMSSIIKIEGLGDKMSNKG
jgi:hypothetical protein